MLGVVDYPSSRVVFLDQEQLTSMGVQEHMAPLLFHPLTHSSLLLLPLPLCSLENGGSALGKLDGNTACCILGLNMRKASLQS